MDRDEAAERAGNRLKRLREDLGLTLRQVESQSRRLAYQKQNQDFFISRGGHTIIAYGTYSPSLFKLYALGAIYRVHWSTIFALFGCNLSEFGRDQSMFAPRRTQLAAEALTVSDTIAVPMTPLEELKLERT